MNGSDASFDVVDDTVRIGAFKHHYYATDSFGRVHHERAVSGAAAVLDGGYVADKHRHARCIALDDDFLDVFQRFHQSDATNKVRIRLLIDVGTARVFIIFLERGENVIQRETHAAESFGIHRHFVLLDEPAVAVDVGHPGGTQHFPPYHPILQGAEFHRVVFAFIAFLDGQAVLEDFAQTR